MKHNFEHIDWRGTCTCGIGKWCECGYCKNCGGIDRGMPAEAPPELIERMLGKLKKEDYMT